MSDAVGSELLQEICAWAYPVNSESAARVIGSLPTIQNPTLFAECLHELLERADVVASHGPALSRVCLDIAAARSTSDALRLQLRAGDALEAATRLALGGTNQLRVASVLGELTRPEPPLYAAAAVRCASALFEQRRLPELMSAVRALGGLDGEHHPSDVERAWVEQIAEDVSYELGAMTLLVAVNSREWEDVAANLERAEGFFLRASSRDAVEPERGTRPDAQAFAALARVFQIVVASIRDPDQRPDSDVLKILASEVYQAGRHFLVGYEGLSHWRAWRATAHLAWGRLSRDLARVYLHLEEDSWYDARSTLALVLDTISMTRVSGTWLRNEDREAVRGIIAPSIGDGIAARAGLVAHLNQHAEVLGRAIEQGGLDSHEQASAGAELTLTKSLLTEVDDLSARPNPKDDGSSHSGLDSSKALPFPTTSETSWTGIARLGLVPAEPPVNLTIDQVYLDLERMLQAYAASVPSVVREAVNDVLDQLIRYVAWALDSQKDRGAYLYKPTVSEKEFSLGFQTFLAHGRLAYEYDSEVPNRAGGRVDIVFRRDGFSLVVELKVERNDSSTEAMSRYLTQAATYQATNVAIGFLLVLDATPHYGLLPSIRSLFSIEKISDSDGVERVIVVAKVPGNRRSPSRLT